MMFTMPAGTHQRATMEVLDPGVGDRAGGGAGPPLQTLAAAKRHVANIASIAAEVGRPFEEVTAVYQRELQRMSAQAAVLDYLPVLVGKHVRQLYRRRTHPPEPGSNLQ